MAGKATRYVRDATPPSLSIAISSTQSFRWLSLALLMASATPVSSEGSPSISTRQQEACADCAMIRNRHTWPTRGSKPTGSGPHRGLHHSPCVPLLFPACTWGPLYTPTCMRPNISSTVSLGHAQTHHSWGWPLRTHVHG